MPKLRKRYAGKTFPAEKFAILRSEQFFKKNQSCRAPAYELFYVWNIFSMISKDDNLLRPIHERLCRELEKIHENNEDDEDEKYTLYLLKGVTSKYLREHESAIECFNQILHQ